MAATHVYSSTVGAPSHCQQRLAKYRSLNVVTTNPVQFARQFARFLVRERAPNAPTPRKCQPLRAASSVDRTADEDLGKLIKNAQMKKGRAAMRLWWLAQLLERAEKEAEAAESCYADAAAFAKEWEMEEGRALLRFWWLDRLLLKLDPSRTRQPASVQGRAKPIVRRQQAVRPTREAQTEPPPEPKEIITKDVARLKALAVPIEEIVSAEVQKERAILRRKMMEAQAEKQRVMDLSRLAMRKWWVQEREATKRALGLPPYGPVWTLVRTDGKQGPISIGKTPLVIGSDVSHMEKGVPVQLDYPTVSRVHARIFGKEVLSYGEYVRGYFVVDLSSTNGVRLNDKMRLRPGDEYRLSDGDVLYLGEKASTLIIRKPK